MRIKSLQRQPVPGKNPGPHQQERLLICKPARDRERGRMRLQMDFVMSMPSFEFAMIEEQANAFPELNWCIQYPVHQQSQNRRKDEQHAG
jgi:hypothetical protein